MGYTWDEVFGILENYRAEVKEITKPLFLVKYPIIIAAVSEKYGFVWSTDQVRDHGDATSGRLEEATYICMESLEYEGGRLPEGKKLFQAEIDKDLLAGNMPFIMVTKGEDVFNYALGKVNVYQTNPRVCMNSIHENAFLLYQDFELRIRDAQKDYELFLKRYTR
jgi:hypothetical protein